MARALPIRRKPLSSTSRSTPCGSTQHPLPPPINFEAIGRAALPHLEAICRRWLPGGVRVGREWTCGSLSGEAGTSCKVNLQSGRWADFATGQRGGDIISLAAAIHHLTQGQAARRVARMLGFALGGRHV
jgi:hypothetical protein